MAIVQRGCLLPLTDGQGRLRNGAVWHQHRLYTKWADSHTRHHYLLALSGLTLSVWEAGTAASLLVSCEGSLKYHCSIVFSIGSCPHKFCLLKPKVSVHLCPYPPVVISLHYVGIWQGENYESVIPKPAVQDWQCEYPFCAFLCRCSRTEALKPRHILYTSNRLSSFYFSVFSLSSVAISISTHFSSQTLGSLVFHPIFILNINCNSVFFTEKINLTTVPLPSRSFMLQHWVFFLNLKQ